ncbi:MAG: oligosaccharide flippase family protein [Gemmatimonadaceae bacterium]
MIRGGIRRDTVAVLAAQSFYRLSGFVLLMVLSRKLGASDIGAFFFAIAFAESLVVLSHFGMGSIMSRRVASSSAEAASHFAPVLGFRAVSAPLYLVIVLGIGAAFTNMSIPLLAAAALITLLEDFYFSFGALFLALRKATYNVSLGVVIHSVYIAAFLIGMWIAPSLAMLVGVTLFRAVTLVLGGAWLTQTRLFPLSARQDWATVKAAVPFVLITALHVFRDQIGTLLLGTKASYEEVAHFNLAWRLVASAHFVPTAVCAVIVPLLTAHGLTGANRRLVLRAAAGVGAVGFTGAAITWLLAEPLAAVMYGPLGTSVAPVLRALAIVFPVGFLALFLSLVLQALYEEAHVLRVLLIVTGSNLVVSWILIPRLGAVGAAYAQIVSASLQLLILSWRLRTLHSAARRTDSPVYTDFPDGSP